MAIKSKTGAMVACILFYTIAALNGAVLTPALEHFHRIWPDISFTMVAQLSTIGNAIAIPVAIIVGILVGRSVKFRPLIMTSMVLMTAGGLLPFFIHPNFWTVFAFRIIFGLGFGINYGLQGVTVIRLFHGEEQGKVIGYGIAGLGVGTIVFPLVAGYLCDVNVFYIFAVYFIALAFMIAIGILMPEPDPLPVVEKTADEKKEARLTPFAVGIIAINLITFIMFYPMWIGSSTVIVAGGLGTAASVGWLATIAAIGQIIAGAIFGRYYAKLKTWTLPVTMVFVAIGLIILATAQTLVMYWIGGFVIGFFNSGFLISAIYRIIGETQTPSAVAASASIVGASCNAGAFITPFWMRAVEGITGNPDPRICFWFGAPVLCALAVASIFYIRNQYRKQGLL